MCSPSFDVRTLFWRCGPVLLRRSDRDESSVQLSIRLLAEVAPSTQLIKLVRLYISNETDPSFLHTLEVASENYGRIKEAEQLLVDFAGFVDRLVWLLEQCCHKETPETYNHASESSSGQDEHEPQFRAVLCVGSPGCGTLRLVQANAFKELAHLTLQLRAGSDASIKQFLSFRLHEVQAELTGARTKLVEVERSRASLAQELQTCRKTSDAAAAKHEVVQKQKEDEIKALKEHVCTLEQRIGDMTQQAQRAAAALTEAEKRTTAAETAAQCDQHAKSGADVELAECLSRVAAAEARCQAAEGRAAAAAERCQGFEAALKQAEARVEEWRGAATRQETRAIAVEEEAASLREKSRGTTRDHEVVSRRLEEVTNELAMARKRVSDAQAEIQAGKQGRKDQESRIRELESALASAQQQANEATKALEESKTQVASNEKMISWLNKQLTTAQLHAAGSATSRRREEGFKFPASVPAPVTPGASKPPTEESSRASLSVSSAGRVTNGGWQMADEFVTLPRPWLGGPIGGDPTEQAVVQNGRVHEQGSLRR